MTVSSQAKAFAATTALVLSASVTGAQPTVREVTEEILANPDADDWPSWRRTRDSWGYSPLNEINAENVEKLQLVWSWALPSGLSQDRPAEASQPAPLVHAGVMFIPGAGGTVQALNAETGELLWEYRREFPEPVQGLSITRNAIALSNYKVILTTTDAYILALDARTGEVVWERKVADHSKGYRFSSGPLIVDGKAIAGLAGCDYFKDDACYIVGYDVETGEELWRTSTVAKPGEPGGDSWGLRPLNQRAGSDTWTTGSYDARTHLIYWSTSGAKPWAMFQRGGQAEHKELYTNSTLALDPDTGAIKWFHQYLPGDPFDMDETFENVLIDQDGIPALFHMGKLGVMWKLDRRTGAFLAAYDPGYQNLYDINAQTGTVTVRPGLYPEPDKQIDMCPTLSGFKTWRAMAYHPATDAVYIPMNLTCSGVVFPVLPAPVEGGGGSRGASRIRTYPEPSSQGNIGLFLAFDTRSGRVLWEFRTKTPMMSAALATGGNLVVAGDWDRHLYFLDATTGALRYQTRLPTTVQGFPITYSVNGKQYIAVTAATGDVGWARVAMATFPDLEPPSNGNAVFVFALPD